MSTLSSLATAEQAQLRLFLSQQNQSNNHQSINQSFFKTTPSLKPLDFEFNDLPSIDQSTNQSYDQPIDQSTKQNDFNRLLDQSFEQSFDQSINQYSVTGDFYSAAQSSIYQSFDKKIDEYQPIKQSTNYDYQPNNQSITQRKRGYEETVPDFGANKRQSTGQSINRFADEIWPDSADMLFPTGSYSSINQSASQPTNQSFYQSDFNFNEIGLLDLSRLNSLGDQLLRNQSSNQLINQSIKRSTTGQSFDAMLNPSINQSINFSPILSRQHSILDSPQPEVFNSGNHQAINQLINQSSNQSANQSIGSPHSTVSQQSVAPDNYIERLINHSIDYTQNHRSVSQSSSVVSISPQQHQHQSIAVPPVSFSVAQSIAQPIIQPISQPSNEIIPKGEGHRRMKRRLTDKQRRAKIKDGLEHLRSLVHLHGDSSTDQASVVQSSINLIKQLVVESSSMKGELNRLKEEGVGISIQLQAQMHAAQTINQTMNQPINQPPRRPLQREQSNEQANNQSQAAQSLLSSLLNNQSDNQSTNQSTNQSNNQPMDGSMLSSYLLQTIQILSQLPISRMT